MATENIARDLFQERETQILMRAFQTVDFLSLLGGSSLEFLIRQAQDVMIYRPNLSVLVHLNKPLANMIKPLVDLIKSIADLDKLLRQILLALGLVLAPLLPETHPALRMHFSTWTSRRGLPKQKSSLTSLIARWKHWNPNTKRCMKSGWACLMR